MIKNNKKRLAFLSLLAVLLIALFCACGQGSETTGSTQPESTDAVTDTPDTGAPEVSDAYIHAFSELNQKEHEADSHKDTWKLSYLEDNNRDNGTYEGIKSLSVKGYYPRVKKLNDGRYMLVMHNGEYGGKVYVNFAPDITKFSAPTEIFGSVKLDGETKYYMTPDAVQLPNGRIIVTCSYRSSSAYEKDISKNGIVIRYTDDGGKTWSDQQTVYVGTNWEPSLLATGGSEVKLMFTSTAETIEKYGFDNRYGVVGMLTSKDNGATWTPNITQSPWSAQVIAQHYLGEANGMLQMTDQMPVATILNNGTTVLAVEEQQNSGSGENATKKFSLGFAYSKNAFSDVSLKFGEAGPADAIHKAFSGAGPYIRQFPSGETVLTLHWAGDFRYRIGDANAKSWKGENTLFTKVGHWGSVEIDGSHSCIMTIGKETYGLYLTRLYLNHAVNAPAFTPELDGDGVDWKEDEAWFIGSDSQAQCSVRFAHDSDRIYVLAERLDTFIEDADSITVILDDKTAGGFYSIKIAPDGTVSATRYNADTKRHSNVDVSANVKASISVCGTVSTENDKDKGILYEIAIDKSLTETSNGKLNISVSLQNKDKKSGKLVTDLIDGTDLSKKETWIPVTLG